MPRTKPFASRHEITDEALRGSAIDLRAYVRAKMEAETESRGPRGGLYRLGPVNSWVEMPSDRFDRPGVTVLLGYRTGTYVRPRHDAPSERRSATTAKAMR